MIGEDSRVRRFRSSGRQMGGPEALNSRQLGHGTAACGETDHDRLRAGGRVWWWVGIRRERRLGRRRSRRRLRDRRPRWRADGVGRRWWKSGRDGWGSGGSGTDWWERGRFRSGRRRRGRRLLRQQRRGGRTWRKRGPGRGRWRRGWRRDGGRSRRRRSRRAGRWIRRSGRARGRRRRRPGQRGRLARRGRRNERSGGGRRNERGGRRHDRVCPGHADRLHDERAFLSFDRDLHRGHAGPRVVAAGPHRRRHRLRDGFGARGAGRRRQRNRGLERHQPHARARAAVHQRRRMVVGRGRRLWLGFEPPSGAGADRGRDARRHRRRQRPRPRLGQGRPVDGARQHQPTVGGHDAGRSGHGLERRGARGLDRDGADARSGHVELRRRLVDARARRNRRLSGHGCRLPGWWVLAGLSGCLRRLLLGRDCGRARLRRRPRHCPGRDERGGRLGESLHRRVSAAMRRLRSSPIRRTSPASTTTTALSRRT